MFESKYYLTEEQIVEKFNLSEENRDFIVPQIKKAEDDFFMYITSKI